MTVKEEVSPHHQTIGKIFWSLHFGPFLKSYKEIVILNRAVGVSDSNREGCPEQKPNVKLKVVNGRGVQNRGGAPEESSKTNW